MTDPSALNRLVSKALALLDTDPGPLRRALDAAAAFEGEPTVTIEEIVTHLATAAADDPVRLMIHQRLAQWDAVGAPAWGEGSAAQTRDRRGVIYRLLDVGPANEAFDQHFPPHLTEFPEFTITREYERWFVPEEQEAAGFYWPKYRDYLASVDGWPAPSTAALSRATTGVVERLAQPTREEIFQSRGLVVGFVQSGKTANFTGVIARAVDAGYRLIIILAGTTNLLREQTQRRLDKQLIGKEALVGIAGAEDEYRDAPDWDRFISYGAEPGTLGACDWVRLTTLESDYKRLGAGPGLAALEFEQEDPAKPLYDATNLRGMRARLVVAKKNRAPLAALARDLKRVKETGIPIEQIPALIIDDESDQASLNTKRPSKSEIQKRTSINAAITDLLDLLKRAQYVGYTATPSATVFADPNDELSIFPRDYITSLERPVGYMGASDYHDFGARRDGFASNEKAYVRGVYGEDASPENLLKALDCFLLTGAIKLYREARDVPINCRHHTMLVHTSQRQADHSDMALEVNRLFEHAGYLDGTADARLSTLLATDFRPVADARAADLPFPEGFGECRPFLEQCITRLETGPERVLIVNGLKENEPLSPDFDRDDVWKIIVGGTKLSRGYTVEGLTISYYRRAARAADTLMQMGRWFGFRRGYMDLMRLFIGRAEGAQSLDLYSAFEAICRDELEFRRELLQYALPEDGSEPITPMQVPPLVTQHLADLAPTAKNKMYNAVIQSENFGGRAIAPTLAPTEHNDVEENQKAATALFKDVDLDVPILGSTDESFAALAGVVTPTAMLEFLETYRWSRPGVIQRQINFLRGELGDPEIDRWVAMWPLLGGAGAAGTWPLHGHEVTVIERFRYDNGRFSVYTDPAHVRAARAIALLEDLEGTTAETEALAGPRTAAALLYAVRGPGEKERSIGFYLVPPTNAIEDKIKWGVRAADRPDEPIVEVPAEP